MEAKPTIVESGHEDMIHDLKFDYYGLRMATASSDRTVRIFDVDPKTGEATLAPGGVLAGHDGPVWEVSWSHPKFGGCLLASCSHDRSVMIWKEDQASHKWSVVYKHTSHSLSVNSVAWAPHEYGLLLACGSSDGNVSFVRLCDNGRWQAEVVPVEEGGNHCGVTSVSWAPAGPAMRLAVGCCDGTVRVFSAAAAAAAAKWSQTVAGRHGDWVRCVAWAPCAAECGGNAVIASCAQDCEVAVWKAAKDSAAAAAAAWEKVLVGPGKFPDGAWTVAWSECGTTLAVTAADGKVSLWKESFDSDAWDCIDTFDDDNNDDDDATNAEN